MLSLKNFKMDRQKRVSTGTILWTGDIFERMADAHILIARAVGAINELKSVTEEQYQRILKAARHEFIQFGQTGKFSWFNKLDVFYNLIDQGFTSMEDYIQKYEDHVYNCGERSENFSVSLRDCGIYGEILLGAIEEVRNDISHEL